jgi:hypothetical protein
MTVLYGHTHGSGEAEILPDLRVRTVGAVYGKPCVQRALELESRAARGALASA